MSNLSADTAEIPAPEAVPIESGERAAQKLKHLYFIGAILERAASLPEALGEALAAMARAIHARRGTIGVFDRTTGQLRVEASFGLPLKRAQQIPGGVGGPVNRRVFEKERVVVSNLPNEEGDEGEALVAIALPVRHGKEVIGTLCLAKPRADYSEIAEDAELLRSATYMIAQHMRMTQRAYESRDRLEQEQLESEKMAERFLQHNLVGTSGAMKQVYQQILQVAPTDTTVLLRGQSGTGKELVAQAIHYNSNRRGGPFVRVNCGALAENLLESELFGHVKGSFTGALKDRIGRFEAARGGTIFLDEVGDFSPAVQVKLLRVLQEREFERVGGTETIQVDVRVIAATHKNLEAMIENGQYREDLFYRLNVFSISLPPLTERRSDITLLADYFVEKYARIMNKAMKRISTPAIDMLVRYHWPGNVRELQNVIERAVLLSTDGVVHGHHLPPTLQTAEATATEMTGTMEDQIAIYEREIIVEALKRVRGNVASASRDLGMTYRKLSYRIQAHNIDPRTYRR
ncbi:sigma 54-interacting transcriptional regulator [bacterium]|nr:sigma 54-interacting transcriptional regulator [bacterium]